MVAGEVPAASDGVIGSLASKPGLPSRAGLRCFAVLTSVRPRNARLHALRCRVLLTGQTHRFVFVRRGRAVRRNNAESCGVSIRVK